jgi:hypothetical protein
VYAQRVCACRFCSAIVVRSGMASPAGEVGARASFASLPHALALNVFARLPVDERARCAAVCRG